MPVRQGTWATLRLIALVRDLRPEQRAWSAPGTYGSIEQTLGHIVGAEHYYLYRLTGEMPSAELKPASTVDLADLEERVRWCSDRLERLCVQGFDQHAPTHRNPGDPRMPTMGGMVTQLLCHGTEHRAQIATILGAHGVESPDTSGWTYAEQHPPAMAELAAEPPGPLPPNPWDAHAEAYQRFVRLREEADLAVDPFVSAMLSSLGEVTGREVLDACCGEGFFSRVLATRGARVIGVDLSPRLIEMARERQEQGRIRSTTASVI
ncbi:MAG: methyltransferase domain-containing protein [Chloroflexota bacterium]|nr:methyltransferase domain-containing protein [Chloroflexota bacterium]